MATTQRMPAKAHSTDDVHTRPKSILKNSRSFQNVPVTESISPPRAIPPIPETADTKELTLQNTLVNAGPRRRSSSNTQAGSLDRRHSSTSDHDENSPRLKWDEANLYLTEQERTAKMKIDEPKTPYAPHYDPAEDEDEMHLEEAKESLIDAQDIMVDELDHPKAPHKKGVSEDDIPDFELGESEAAQQAVTGFSEDPRIYRQRSMSNESQKGEKHVHVGGDANGEDGDDGLLSTEEAREKHRIFEKQRKQHYEMSNIKDLLAHPETLDEMEEDEDEAEPGPPPAVPQIPQQFRAGGQ